MTWEHTLFAGLIGCISTFLTLAVAFRAGYRWQRELPKLPIKESIHALEQHRGSLLEETNDLSETLRKSKAAIAEAEASQKWLAENESHIANLQQRKREHDDVVARLAADMEERDRVVEEREQARLRRDELSREVVELEAKLASQKHVLEHLQNLEVERDRLEQVVPALRVEHRELSAAVDRAKEQRAELASAIGELERQITALKAELSTTEAKLVFAERVFDQLALDKEELGRLEHQLPGLRSEHQQLEAAITKGREECAKGREECESTIKRLNILKTEEAQLEGRIEADRKTVSDLLDQLKLLKTSVVAAGGIDESKDPLQDLWEPVIKRALPEGGTKQERERVDHLHERIRTSGFMFPERTIHAFHTALKTAELSPIAVLAGISGTGKSLLPQLYASGMGIHFLNMPVQPRWDSPQDLFGFYNYIEQKYKATELGRVMRQFDPYRDGESGAPAIRDRLDSQMLLVLLDEMNLARIEYYFSELLSRLELRRDADETSEIDRAKVAIPLDIGHLGKDRKAFRIYPGKNVLFCGTMNEDESTQSLSDKVLDRASVLRFGRPNRAETERPKREASPPENALPFKAWCEWKERARVASTQAASHIQKLNKLMDRVGRPFGHRVAQAMAEYVRFYPDWISGGENKALADQVEQKILPKLRGLDLETNQDVFKELLELVEQLNDDLLHTALKTKIDVRAGGFLWNGLDRTEE